MRLFSEALYREMLEKLAHAQGRWRSESLCVFAGVMGQKYDGELLVVGRAPNTWHIVITAEEMLSELSIEKVIAELIADDFSMTSFSEGWGAKKANGKYNTAKSAFWRVIRKVVQGLGIADVTSDSWP